MPLVIENVAEDTVYSYDTRLQSIGTIFDTTHQLLEGFQESFLDTKQEKGKISNQVRDILAKNEHLRRKDFDNMMQGILSIQDDGEKEVRNLLKSYLNEQKGIVQGLMENLVELKDSIAKGEAHGVIELQGRLKEILILQNKRREEVVFRLKEFQREQRALTTRFKELLAKGDELRIRDLKLMLKELKLESKSLESRV